MKFGPVPLAEAQGAILAHSCRAGGRKIGKGRVLQHDDVSALAADGWTEVTVARLDPNDVGEDIAAARLAEALVPAPNVAHLRLSAPFTGRVNIHATAPGVVFIDADRVCAFNRVDSAITLATLPPLARVEVGTMVATVKIISYAVPEANLTRVCQGAAGALHVQRVLMKTASLILTEVPEQPAKLNEKARRVIAARLAPLGMQLTETRIVPHRVADIAEALEAASGDMVLMLTGSATSDLHDTGPEALRATGGHVARFGIPVDPGNLLFHGSLRGRPVVGLPGCARSPAINGADWVVQRLACGLSVSEEEVARMGVGGLLKEMPGRPQPREAQALQQPEVEQFK